MWIIPTMGRPAQLQTVLEMMVQHGLSTPGLVLVNGTENESDYRAVRLPESWGLIVLPENIGICDALNWVFSRLPNEAWYGLICDDEFVLTDEFDRIIIDAAGRCNIAHGNDGWKSAERLWTYVVWGGELIRTVGWWALPGLWHWYFDDVWETVASDFQLKRWCQNVRTEHRHYSNGTAVDDVVYKIGRSRSENDRQTFERWKANEYSELKDKLSRTKPYSLQASKQAAIAVNDGVSIG